MDAPASKLEVMTLEDADDGRGDDDVPDMDEFDMANNVVEDDNDEVSMRGANAANHVCEGESGWNGL